MVMFAELLTVKASLLLPWKETPSNVMKFLEIIVTKVSIVDTCTLAGEDVL